MIFFTKEYAIFLMVLGGLFFWAMVESQNGWGYPAYGNRYHSASFFYFGSPDFYHERDVRSLNRRGGGIHSGK